MASSFASSPQHFCLSLTHLSLHYRPRIATSLFPCLLSALSSLHNLAFLLSPAPPSSATAADGVARRELSTASIAIAGPPAPAAQRILPIRSVYMRVFVCVLERERGGESCIARHTNKRKERNRCLARLPRCCSNHLPPLTCGSQLPSSPPYLSSPHSSVHGQSTPACQMCADESGVTLSLSL